MPFDSDEQVVAIGEGLTACTLPRSQWTHAAHVAAAVWLLRQRPGPDTSTYMPGLIRAYNESTGLANTDTSGYHETITQASLRATRRFLLDHPGLSLSEACNALLAGALGRSDWLFEYWSRARLFSPEARRHWLEPDLKPLPF